jgi:hypothetical protein
MSTQEHTQSADAARKSTFDQTDRERLRAALFRYMEEHRIGVPTLIAHMAKAVKREARYIPQKTLQRFLAGEMRTNDASVAIFHEFARTLPPARDELAELTLTLGQYFRHPAGSGEQGQSVPLPTGTYAGAPADPRHPYSPKNCTLRVLTGSRLAEREHPPALWPEARPDEIGTELRGERFEGAVVAFNGFHVGVLRSTATRRPRIHWFTPDGGSFRSFCQSAPVQDGRGQTALVVSGYLTYVPAPDTDR